LKTLSYPPQVFKGDNPQRKKKNITKLELTTNLGGVLKRKLR